jgi:chromosome segregation ATPase
MEEVQIQQQPVDQVRSDKKPSLSFTRITNPDIKRLTAKERKDRCDDITNFITFTKNKISENKNIILPRLRDSKVRIPQFVKDLENLISGHIKEIGTLKYNIEKTNDADSLQWLKKELKNEEEALESRKDTLKTTETDLLEIDKNIKNLEKEAEERTLEKAITDFTSQYETLCSKNPNRLNKLRHAASDPPKPPEVSWVLSKYDDNDLKTAKVNLLSTHPPQNKF